jgi:hypothetical protein
MKNINFFVIILFAAFVHASSLSIAQVGHNYKAQNISQNGEILDSKNKMVGKIEKDGTVKDHMGNNLGRIAGNGIVTDAKGNKLGKVSKNGTFYDLNDQVILTVTDKGDVRDSKGHYLFKVHPEQKMNACAIHCFFMIDDKNKSMLYICPMHSEVRSDKAGKCPKCGISLVEKK